MGRILAWAATVFLAASANAEEIQVVYAGKYQDPITAYTVGRNHYLNAKDVGSVYGGQVYWYPVGGRVQMSFRGRPLQFLADSETATAGGKKFNMGSKMIVRAGQAFIPLSLFSEEAFSAWLGLDTQFNARTRLLTVDKRSSMGPLRWFSYKQSTRFVIELQERLAYNLTRRGLAGLELTIPMGVIEASEQGTIEDGLVSSYVLRQDLKVARLSVRLQEPGLSSKVRELSNPRRLVLDIYKDTAPVIAAEKKISSPPPAAAAPRPAQEELEGAASQAEKMVVLPSVVTPTGRAKRRIVVDAGHGGKDAGATGKRGTYEKDINLLAATELARLLREEDAFEVLLTRSDDTFVPLGDRSRMANEFGADLFISLHCNASKNRRDTGFEIYYLSERASDPEAARIAEFENSVLALEDKSAADEEAAPLLLALTKTEHINAAAELSGLLAQALGRRLDLENRGVKEAAFYVLRGTNAPAVLFEMAYVSNQKDETKIESAKYRRKIIDGVYAGILEYSKRQGWLFQP